MTGNSLTTEDVTVYAAAVRSIEPLQDRELQLGLDLVQARTLARGEHLLRGGQKAKAVALVVRGLLREHFVLPDGLERTKAFVVEGQFSGSLADLLALNASRAFIVAEEPCRLLVAPFDAYRALALRSAAWDRFSRRSVERVLLGKAEREYELLGLDAEARYAAFVTRYPGLEARVAARHVASYLGITPVHLSRLRRKRRDRRRGSR